VSVSTISMTSEISATSSFAAIRGLMFLPCAVAGVRTAPYPSASGTTSASKASAMPFPNSSLSARSTFRMPAIPAASAAIPAPPAPATRTSTSSDSFSAAVTVFWVAFLSDWLS